MTRVARRKRTPSAETEDRIPSLGTPDAEVPTAPAPPPQPAELPLPAADPSLPAPQPDTSFAAVARQRVAAIGSDPTGAVMVPSGRYARHATLTAFEMLGGVPALVEWARENPGEYYTKLFAKTIQREVEVTSVRTIEDAIAEIDGVVDTVATEVTHEQDSAEDDENDDGE